MNFGRRICCEPEIKSGMWTHLDIDGESSRKDVGDNNKKKINLCGGRPHPGLERGNLIQEVQLAQRMNTESTGETKSEKLQ